MWGLGSQKNTPLSPRTGAANFFFSVNSQRVTLLGFESHRGTATHVCRCSTGAAEGVL